MTTGFNPSKLAFHEAAHTAGFLHFGLTPLCARVDRPGNGLAGSVSTDWDTWDLTRDTARSALIAALLGPMFDGAVVENWPLDTIDWPEGCDIDAKAVQSLAEYLALEEVDWRFIVYKARALAANTDFRRLLYKIAEALDERDVLGAPQLTAIFDEVTACP